MDASGPKFKVFLYVFFYGKEGINSSPGAFRDTGPSFSMIKKEGFLKMKLEKDEKEPRREIWRRFLSFTTASSSEIQG
jgi:hypothetical protein